MFFFMEYIYLEEKMSSMESLAEPVTLKRGKKGQIKKNVYKKLASTGMLKNLPGS